MPAETAASKKAPESAREKHQLGGLVEKAKP